MPDLLDHFDALARVRPPDTWPDPAEREPRPLPPRRRLGRPVGSAVLAILVAAAGLVFAVRAFHVDRGTTGGPPTATKGAHSQPVPTPAATRNPTPPRPSSPPATGGSSPPPSGAMFTAMLDAIETSSPPGWHFALRGDRLDGDWTLDGDVDDGSGPGRLLVNLTTRARMLEADPCADSEFRQGGRCTERTLPDGDLLVLRDVVVDPGGMKTIEVVLVHPDRSGIGAEAGNWTMATLPDGTPVAQGDLQAPRVTRPDPLYTVERLADLVRAVDASTKGCVETACN